MECLKGKAWVLPLDHVRTKMMHTQSVPLGSNIKGAVCASNSRGPSLPEMSSMTIEIWQFLLEM